MPLKLALAVRGTVAGHRAGRCGGGGGASPPSDASLVGGGGVSLPCYVVGCGGLSRMLHIEAHAIRAMVIAPRSRRWLPTNHPQPLPPPNPAFTEMRKTAMGSQAAGPTPAAPSMIGGRMAIGALGGQGVRGATGSMNGQRLEGR